ncbi:ANTAR domain-containing protein [Jatrophihabitans sp. YIM 134969]
MTADPDLDHFLSELGGRRLRLLSLAEPQPPALLEELTELGEQLLVAEEELRVQQEALEETRRSLRRMAEQRDDLWMSAPSAQAVTDRRGVVRAVNRAAEELLDHPVARTTPRPVATWFAVADRPVVRSMITALTHDRPTAPVVVTFHAPGPAPRRVQLLARAVDDGGQMLLHWELRPVEPGVQVVASGGTEEGGVSAAAIAAFAAFAADLGARADPTEVVALAAEGAVALVPGAEVAGVTVAGKGGRLTTRDGSSSQVAVLDRIQSALGEGPALECVATDDVVLVSDVASEARWPAFASAATAQGVGSMLVVPMSRRGGSTTVLTLVADRRDALGVTDVDRAAAVGVHAGVALQRTLVENDLRVAVESRQLIGEAVGILVERRRITSDDAFAVLVRASQNGNLKLRDLARVVLETGQDPDQIVAR